MKLLMATNGVTLMPILIHLAHLVTYYDIATILIILCILAVSAHRACCNINELPFVHKPRVCVYVRYDSNNKWRLFAFTAVTDSLF